MKYKAFCGRKM